ncbi:dipeptide/oligopeptide/nickel ABC transporter ATP-binding protein [Glaciihabitans sp. GrIS 2.15]|uniref:dipeptide/oligopeptide/nickel ABC transporter ATP-binding protein n=1 Tax=Glaciihabitans sp. GrIS 2.15 TaxID=3071710 RepID=UPI002DF734CD|nr:peptide/nickel transport system ATP-binding protein [Glaciihabitans sp. GrIS 2.15]
MTSANSADLVISARDVSMMYRSNHARPYLAVRGVSFEVAAGDLLGITGESGSGKSTLALAIAGLAGSGGEAIPRICGGQLEVLGTRVRRIGRRSRDRLTLRVGFLRQDAAERLSPLLTVAENVAEPIYQRDRRFSVSEAADAVATVIDAVRLPLSLMNRLPYQLSSGQRQRVALARALVLEPTLLVADEPTRGVDATVRDGVLEAIRDLQRDRGITAVVISSDLAVLTRIAPRIAVMQQGIIVGLGDIDSLTRAPENDYLKGLARSRAALGDTPNRTSRLPGSDHTP